MKVKCQKVWASNVCYVGGEVWQWSQINCESYVMGKWNSAM